MVNSMVASIGAVLVVVGVAMTAAISVLQEWVVVTLPPYTVCDDTPLGNLGLFKATFDPTCTQDDSVSTATQLSYASFEKVESATTEFWPLFPSQTSFNDLVDVEFTTCEEFYANDAVLNQAGLAGIQTALLIGNGSFADQYTLLSTIIAGVFAFLPAALTDIFNENYPTAAALVLSSLNTTVVAQAGPALAGFRAVIAGGTGSTAASLASDFTGGTFDGTQVGVDAGTYSPLSLFGAMAAKIPATPGDITGTAVFASVLAASPPGTVEADLLAVIGLAGVHAGLVLSGTGPAASCATALTFEACLFDDVSQLLATEYVTKDLDNIQTIVSTLLVSSPTDPDLNLASSVLAACVLPTTGKTGLGCTTSVTASSLETTADQSLLCTLVSQSAELAPVFGLTGKLLTDSCTTAELLLGLGQALNVPIFVASLDLESNPAFGALLGDIDLTAALEVVSSFFTTCNDDGQLATYSGCQAYLIDPSGSTVNQAGFPASFLDEDYALCSAAPLVSQVTCDSDFSFGSFIGVLANSTDASTQAIAGVLAECLFTQSIVTLDACLAFFAGVNTTDLTVAGGTKALVGNGFINNFIDGDTTEELIAACNDDEEDARRIGLAQGLVPAAIGFEVVGLAVAVAAIMTGKKALAVVGGVACLAGGAMTLAALLLVQGAPVYEAVGGAEVADEPLYAAGLARTLGLVAIFAPILGGGMIVVGGCQAGKEGADGQVASKTY